MIRQIILLTVCGLIMSDSPSSNPNTEKAVDANNQFSVELLQKLDDGKKNVFFSPYSISAALAMTSLGAADKTLTEIDNTMHFDEVNKNNRLAIHEVYKNLISTYNQENSNYSLSTANRLFGQNNFEIKKKFQDEVKEYYFGELQQLDFSTGQAEGIINKWVEDQTHDKIKDLFKPGSLTPDVVLVLVNAIYFKGNWNTKFPKEMTKDDDFHTSANTKTTVQMMQNTKKFGYFHDEALKAKVLEMPYVGKDLSMFVILPDEIEGLSDVIKQLSAAKLKTLFNSVHEQTVEVKFPKFKLETEYSLVDTLKSLGINDLFSNNANLTEVADGPITISAILHKAMIKVNEKGTVAAASTAAVATYRSFQLPKQFIADHPFSFFIRQRDTEMILLIGSYIKPRSAKLQKPNPNSV